MSLPVAVLAIVALGGTARRLRFIVDAPPAPRPRRHGGDRHRRPARLDARRVKIPPTEQFGIIAQNYYWAWPIATFIGDGVVGSALRGPYRRLRQTPDREAIEAVALAGAVLTAVAAVPLLRPTNLLPETDHEWAVSRERRPPTDRPARRQPRRHGRSPAPVLIDLGAVRHVRYTLLTELQRRGIDFALQRRLDRPVALRPRALRRRHRRVPAHAARRPRGGAAAQHATPAGDGPRAHRRAGRPIGRARRRSSATRCATARSSSTTGAIELPRRRRPGAARPGARTPRTCRRATSPRSSDNWSRFDAVDVAAGHRAADLAEWDDARGRAVDDRMAIYLGRSRATGRPVRRRRPGRRVPQRWIATSTRRPRSHSF